MKLYHGTNIDFEKIDIDKSKPNKDFGRGFYLSADYEQAMNMANIKFEQMEIGSPLVQEYFVDEIEMQKLKCLIFNDYTEEWAKFILQNRYLQPIITQYFIDNKSEIWLLFLIAHSKR